MTEDREAFVASLREVATFYEENPDIPLPYFKELTSYVDGEVIRKVARTIGTARKEHYSTSFVLAKKIGVMDVRYVTQRSNVCRPVVKGQRTIPATPERVVDEVEWVCDDPLLKPTTGGTDA